MSAKHRTNVTYFGMTFLLMSLAIIPVSMKAAGVNLRFSAIVDAWSRVAAVFSDGYQPVAATELLALNQPTTDDEIVPAEEPSCREGVLACSQEPVFGETPAVELTSFEPEVNQQSKPCPKAEKRVGARARVEAVRAKQAVADAKEMRFAAVEVREMTRLDSINGVEMLKAFNKELPTREIDIARVMKSLPGPKDIKVLLRAKALLAPRAAAGVSGCGSSSVKNSELEDQVRRWTFHTRVITPLPAAPEDGEL